MIFAFLGQALMEQSRERQSWSELARGHDVVATTDANSSGTTSISTQDRGGSTSVTGNTDGNRVIMVYDGLSRGIETVRELRTGHDGNNSLESPTYNSDGKIVTQAFYDDNNRVTLFSGLDDAARHALDLLSGRDRAPTIFLDDDPHESRLQLSYIHQYSKYLFCDQISPVFATKRRTD